MTGRFQVETGGLQITGAQLAQLCPEIASSLAALTQAEGQVAGSGVDRGNLVGAASFFGYTWTQALADLEAATGNLGQTVQLSAVSYEVTDQLPDGE